MLIDPFIKASLEFLLFVDTGISCFLICQMSFYVPPQQKSFFVDTSIVYGMHVVY
jgi:hypothetical protein